MHGIEGFGIADLLEEVMGFGGRHFLANQAQPSGDAVDVGIYGEGGTAE